MTTAMMPSHMPSAAYSSPSYIPSTQYIPDASHMYIPPATVQNEQSQTCLPQYQYALPQAEFAYDISQYVPSYVPQEQSRAYVPSYVPQSPQPQVSQYPTPGTPPQQPQVSHPTPPQQPQVSQYPTQIEFPAPIPMPQEQYEWAEWNPRSCSGIQYEEQWASSDWPAESSTYDAWGYMSDTSAGTRTPATPDYFSVSPSARTERVTSEEVMDFASQVFQFDLTRETAGEIVAEVNRTLAQGLGIEKRAMLQSCVVIQKKKAEQQVSFSKWDLNSDGVLDRSEVMALAQKEYGLELQEDTIAELMQSLGGPRGVPPSHLADLQLRLQTMVKARPRSEAEILQVELRAQEARDAAVGVEAAWSKAEAVKRASGQDVGEALSIAKSAQTVIEKARSFVAKLLASTAGAEEERILDARQSVEDYQSLFAERQTSVQKMIHELTTRRGTKRASQGRGPQGRAAPGARVKQRREVRLAIKRIKEAAPEQLMERLASARLLLAPERLLALEDAERQELLEEVNLAAKQSCLRQLYQHLRTLPSSVDLSALLQELELPALPLDWVLAPHAKELIGDVPPAEIVAKTLSRAVLKCWVGVGMTETADPKSRVLRNIAVGELVDAAEHVVVVEGLVRVKAVTQRDQMSGFITMRQKDYVHLEEVL